MSDGTEGFSARAAHAATASALARRLQRQDGVRHVTDFPELVRALDADRAVARACAGVLPAGV